MLGPWAGAYVQRYSDLAMPVIVLAGQEDKLVDTARQSARLKSSLPNASFHAVGGAGHMVHQSDPTAVMAAIEEAAAS